MPNLCFVCVHWPLARNLQIKQILQNVFYDFTCSLYKLDSQINITAFSDELQKRIERLEQENNDIRDEFNVQRAKMKELFLQKESERWKNQ